MTRQALALGTSANDGTGDTLRQAGTKINANFVEIYQRLGGNDNILMPGITFDSDGIIFEGSSTDSHETRLITSDPDADRTVQLPNLSGTVIVDSGSQTLINKTLLSPAMTTPSFKDVDSSHSYNLKPGALSANVNLNLPALSDSDTIVTLTSAGTLTNKTLTTPTLNSPVIGTVINDANGAELIKLTATSSAVNEITLANAATGSGPIISATGGDTNVNINLNAKNEGSIEISKVAYDHTTQNADGDIDKTKTFIVFDKATALAAALKNGNTIGEMKIMINKNSGLATVTPDNFAQGTSFAIAQNGATQCIWSGNNWFMLGAADSADTYITIT